MDSAPVGRVLGTEDATPLEFWVAVQDGEFIQLDDVVALERELPGRDPVRMFGVVAQVRARHEGARFDSDVFLIEDGVLPAEVSEAAQVLTTRFEPEVFVPPLPGAEVRRARGDERDEALFFDGMTKRLLAGLSREDEPLYLNLEFIDGTRGADVNISGISGVATKTTYATFLLHGLFRSDVLGGEGLNTKALIFNVKGEDLLWLDRDNTSLDSKERDRYAAAQIPCSAFESVQFWAPPRIDDPTASPDVSSRPQGITSFFWTLEEFCRGELLRFLFADAEDDRQQYTIVIGNVEAQLAKAVPVGEGAVSIEGQTVRTFGQLVELISERVETDETWAGRSIGQGTVNAFVRRLHASRRHLERLIRADIPHSERHRITTDGAQVTVVDLHNLNDRAKRFVVGVTIRGEFDRKERSGVPRPLLFLVLDELNKYAPREGSSPIKEILLDVAERGRSLGIILIGAQQTASEVERRIIANSAIRVVGRLDAAEAGRDEYGFLPAVQRQRATILKPGTMIVSQPELPIPLVVQFPFPAWATRASEAAPAVGERDEDPFRGAAEMKILHTSDWHIGRALRGRSRADEHSEVLAEIAEIARAESVDLILVVGDIFDSAAPTPESEQIAYAGLLALAATGAQLVVLSGNHDSERRLAAVAPLLGLGRIVTRASFLPAAEGGVVTGETAGGEAWRLATVPFLSQRWVVRAADLMDTALDAADHRGAYAAKVARLLHALTAGFTPDAVNLVAAHLHVDGGLLGGGERLATTIFDYAVSPAAFPASAHYVALGHLHRAQAIPGPCPIRYCGSPLQLDFGETADAKSVTVVSAAAGMPASATVVPLVSGRRLRTIEGTIEELAAIDTGDDWVKVVVRSPLRVGLADEVRDLFPLAVDVMVAPPVEHRAPQARPVRSGRSPQQLFADYLAERDVVDPRLSLLFDLLVEDLV